MSLSRIAYLGLGANLGDTPSALRDAARTIGQLTGCKLLHLSSLYRSAPVGYLDQPDFTNAVAAIETTLSPLELLDALQGVELAFGRQRSFRNAPRTLDLDILLFGDLVLDNANLTIPHPRMLERAFVMVPLAEIAPDLSLHGRRVTQIASELSTGDLKPLADSAT